MQSFDRVVLSPSLTIYLLFVVEAQLALPEVFEVDVAGVETFDQVLLVVEARQRRGVLHGTIWYYGFMRVLEHQIRDKPRTFTTKSPSL
jgi:hypothetical protein